MAPRPVLLLLATALRGAAAIEWTNWGHNQHFSVAAHVNATSESDVAAALAAAANASASGYQGRVKVLGSGHSFSGIDGLLSYGAWLTLVPPPDPVSRLDAGTVRVHAGLPLRELSALLESRWSLALANLGAISMQTVGGATATNTHGTGPTTGLSGFVRGFTIVLANGTVVYANATAHADVFAAGRAGYGALGVLVWVDLAVVPLWRMERLFAPFELSALRAALPALRAQYPRLQWYYTPYNASSAVLLLRTDVPPGTPVTGCWAGGQSYSTGFLTPPPAGTAAWPAGTTACVDVSYKTLTAPGDDATLYTEMEMMVDESFEAAVMDDFLAYQASVRSQANASVPLFTGVRYVAGDDIWLSPFIGRNVSAVVSMIVFGTATAQADPDTVYLYHSGLQAIAMQNYTGRPHPGKNAYVSRDLMEVAYADAGTFEPFAALRNALDPLGLFSNGWLQVVFGGC